MAYSLVTEAAQPESVQQRRTRLDNAKELLGRHYRKSVVRNGEKVKRINSIIYKWTRERLPKEYRAQYRTIAQTIIDESERNGFDPVLIMSVIQGESSFNPSKRGALDEIGLMQIRPSTAIWLAKRAKIPWVAHENSLLDPRLNIKIGTLYLRYLRDRFDAHAQLYLAAYNMGPSNVNSALDRKIWPQDYPVHVMKLYVEFYASI